MGQNSEQLVLRIILYDLNQITKETYGRVGDCRGYFAAVAGLRRRQVPMHLFFKRPVALLLFAALAFVLAARGMVPAMSKIDSDFPNYFTAAKIVADGENVERLYDDSWFQ